jgi:hypothetical protein
MSVGPFLCSLTHSPYNNNNNNPENVSEKEKAYKMDFHMSWIHPAAIYTDRRRCVQDWNRNATVYNNNNNKAVDVT